MAFDPVCRVEAGLTTNRSNELEARMRRDAFAKNTCSGLASHFFAGGREISCFPVDWSLRKSRRRGSLTIGIALFLSALTMALVSDALASERIAEPERALAPRELAAWIDEQFEDAWSRQGLVPAPPTTDAEFVRRAFLDLIGRIPSVAEGREFLSDSRIDKRQILIEELLQRGAFASHLANTWRDLLLAGNSAIDARGQAPALEIWLKLRFSANMPYDQLASELLTASLTQNNPNNTRTPSPLAFYQAAEFKPEQLAASVSKVFLGVQVQCAQCHDHPFAAWKQPQFWSFAAFFKNIDSSRAMGTMQADAGDSDEIQIPGKEVLVPAMFLDGSKPERRGGSDKREILARWVTGPENPLFAKAVVNRVWGNFFGRGFVNPIDDLDPANAPLFENVFDEICVQFRLHRRDLKYLVRTITATRAYQLSSRGTSESDSLTSQFARMPLRRMTSDQIYASFVQATGYREPIANRANGIVTGGARDDFQTKFADSTVSPTEIETTILQALSLMNGRYVTEATNFEQSDFLACVADAPFLDEITRLETLFLATVGRLPDAEELDLFRTPPQTDDAAAQRAKLKDAFWTLLNSAEFLLNH